MNGKIGLNISCNCTFSAIALHYITDNSTAIAMRCNKIFKASLHRKLSVTFISPLFFVVGQLGSLMQFCVVWLYCGFRLNINTVHSAEWATCTTTNSVALNEQIIIFSKSVSVKYTSEVFVEPTHRMGGR